MKRFQSRPFDLAVDTISEQEIEALIEWLRGYPRLTMWEETKRFEQAWSEWLGVRFSVLCNSGSSANLLMYAALDSAKRSGNRKVVVPATGWVTTVSPGIQLGWQPCMCGTDPVTFGADIDVLKAVLERERPDTVVIVHVLGVPNRMSEIMELREAYGFNLLEDCCASHGARHQGRQVGTFGTMSAFSFYYGHHMSTIEGGIVSTDDQELYHHLLMLRSHGWLKDVPDEYGADIMRRYGWDPFFKPFCFVVPGYNLRPSDLNARIGLLQIPHLRETVERRTENHARFQERLRGRLGFAEGLPGDTISSISFCAVATSTAQRRAIVSAMDEHRMDTRLFTAGNLGRHPFWSDRYGVFADPQADKLFDCGFFLPNNQRVGLAEVDQICDVVLAAT